MLLPDGDLLYLTYDRMSDSCETVTRVSADTGRVRWSAWTGAIGVSHSAYFHHAYLDVRGDWVYVVGQASAGDTICVLDLDSGYEERRWIYHFHIVP